MGRHGSSQVFTSFQGKPSESTFISTSRGHSSFSGHDDSLEKESGTPKKIRSLMDISFDGKPYLGRSKFSENGDSFEKERVLLPSKTATFKKITQHNDINFERRRESMGRSSIQSPKMSLGTFATTSIDTSSVTNDQVESKVQTAFETNCDDQTSETTLTHKSTQGIGHILAMLGAN